MGLRMTIGGRARLGTLCAVALALAGCSPTGSGRGGPAAALLPPPSTAMEASPLPASGDPDRIGSGPVRIALIAPLTGPNGPGMTGLSLRNAAELALSAFDSAEVTVLVKDDQSSPAGARAAAQAAIAEGAELIAGPLFAANVREVGAVARAAGKPVIAFSTDASVAGRGVYLLSFLVESYVDRIVDYAAGRGKRSMAALIPNTDYGRVAEAAFITAAARNNIRVMAVERLPSGASATPAAQKIAALGAQIDALFIPEQAEAMAGLSQALASTGIDGKRVQILGTGVWNDARVLKLPALQGAWFAAPDNAGFNAFALSYRDKFGADPSRVATLAYDAIALSVALARQQGAERFSERALQGAQGFNGTDGIFRFKPDGQNERGLSVQMIGNGSTSVISPAPRSFGVTGSGI
jgi:branched-chain amino acid transport system substrate-binding protein